MAGSLAPAALAKRGLAAVQRRASRGQRVIFIHVPKCGGTSIVEALRQTLTVQGLGAAQMNPVATKRIADDLGEEVLDIRERWLLYQVADGRYSLLTGHFPYSPLLLESPNRYRTITLLREPAAQFLSEFFYNRDKPGKHSAIDPDATLKGFLQTDRAREIGCKFVQYFTDPTLRAHATEPEAVAAAAANISHVDVVGVLENVDGWAADVSAMIGRPLKIGQKNSSPTPSTQRTAEVDDEALALVDEITRPNRAVYDAAVARSA